MEAVVGGLTVFGTVTLSDTQGSVLEKLEGGTGIRVSVPPFIQQTFMEYILI